MLKSYFKLAWRNLLKHKTDSTINIIGLCIAFTCALLLFLSVYFEFSFDHFQKNAKNIYHLYFIINQPKQVETNSSMPVPLTPALKQSYPQIKYAARYINSNCVIRYGDKKITTGLKLTDPDFFKMFSFPFTQGDPGSVLNNLNDIVLSEDIAKAIFGNVNPIGNTVEIQLDGDWKPFKVSGIAANYPENSSITYNIVMRFENQSDYKQNVTSWDSWNHDVYVQLQNGAKPLELQKSTASLISKSFAKDIEDLKRDGALPFKDGSYIQLHFQPLLDIHTDTKIQAEGSVIGKGYLYLLLTIGVLILVIACINFINLGIGRSFTRTHEIGLRKTLGAQKHQLIGQFWSEAFLVCLFALLMSSCLTYWLLPMYKQLFGMNIQRDVLLSPFTWLSVAGIFFVITVLAGGYPAWFMSRFNIINILKGKVSIKRSQMLRNSLIVVQFSIAILLMICTIVAWQQINYLRTKPLGYNKNQIISIPIEEGLDPVSVLETMKAKLAAYPSVESISGIYNNLGRGLDGTSRRSAIGFDYKNKGVNTDWMGISYDFTKTLDLKIVAGRDFSRDFPSDSNAVVINEAMAEQLGEKNPVGALLQIRDDQPPKQVIGVIKNFNYMSLHGKIEPLTLALEARFPPHYILVKVKPNDLPGSMELVKSIWRQVAPGQDFKGSFLDENIDRQYRKEEKLGKIFVDGAIVAIILSCMGLLAMVILIIAQRIKEIGIRKVLGASAYNIVTIVSKDFILLIFVAFVIASPFAWFFMNRWLEDFAYRINIQFWVFGVTAICALLIAFVTICLQGLKAAFMNPVKTLRAE
jgi:ABC-type antimicrobial peptide transport system permease subunit